MQTYQHGTESTAPTESDEDGSLADLPLGSSSFQDASPRVPVQIPSAVMERRVSSILRQHLLPVDLEDMATNRQIAPEYANRIYQTILKDEYAIGNYLESEDCSLKISTEQRSKMVNLIQGLH